MELFTLGVTDANGNPELQPDRRARTWRARSPATRSTSRRRPGSCRSRRRGSTRHQDDLRPDRRLRRAGRRRARALAAQPRAVHRQRAVERVHRRADPGRRARVADERRTWRAEPQLQPLLRGILSHPLIFDSLEEPTMIKSPVVYTVGVLRATGAPLRGGPDRRARATCCSSPTTRRMSPAGRAGSPG